jgi:hypothetical protein
MPQRVFSCILALLTATTCGVAAFFSFDRMIQEDSASNALLAGLRMGDNHFVFRNSANSGGCFGTAVLQLGSEEHSFHIHTEGWAQFELGGQTVQPEWSGELGFNPLSQLGNSVFTLSVGDQKFRFGTKNINPITAVLILNAGENEQTFEQNIPGPFEILPSGDDSFRIVGPAITNALQSTPFLTATAGPLPELQAKVDRSFDPNCTRSSAVPMSLAPLKSLADSIRTKFSGLLPGT